MNTVAKKFVYCQGDDWVGLYVDGECVYQGHSLDAWRVAQVAELDWSTLNEDSIMTFLDDHGSFPRELSSLLAQLKEIEA
jgi:hypothetical protein